MKSPRNPWFSNAFLGLSVAFGCVWLLLEAGRKSDHSIPALSPAAEPAPPLIATPEPAQLDLPPTPAASDSDEELLGISRLCVTRSPEQAVAWANTADDALLRERLLFAVIHAWGEQDAQASVTWSLQQNEDCRFKRMEAALTGAARQPALALGVVRKLLADDPVTGSAYGTALLGALCSAGEFPTAVLLGNGTSGGTLEDTHLDWLTFAFRRWAEQQPEAALEALRSITGEEMRDPIFQAVVQGWARNNAADLAAYAVSLPPGEARSAALIQAVNHWCLQDPAGMGAWLTTFPAAGDTDWAVAQMITRTDGANRSPEVALAWVETMSDPSLKRSSLEHVLQEWTQTNPATARKYVESTALLDADERQKMLAELQAAISTHEQPDPALE